MPRFRVAFSCCLLAAIVAVMPALPCLLTCAAEGHMTHLEGGGQAPPGHDTLPCHHQLPQALGSVVSTLVATIMLPPSAWPVPMVRADTVTSARVVPTLPSIPQLIPDPPPPRLG
jgi:hypothetical protein